jgi:RHS repeat-associated protein
MNYYPFGLKHKGYNNVTSANGNSVAQKFKYNGKELYESLGYNMYEYESRHFDATLGRFSTIDPKADLFSHQSPFVYSVNNPVYFEEKNGEFPFPPGWKKAARSALNWLGNKTKGSSVAQLYTGWMKAGVESLPDSQTDSMDNTTRLATTISKAADGDISGAIKTYDAGGVIAMTETVEAALDGDMQSIGKVAFAVFATIITKKAGGKGKAVKQNNKTGRAKNKLKPDEDAGGDHSTFKRDADGNVTSYETYSKNPQNPSGFDTKKRYDGTGKGHYDKKTGEMIETPHVHEGKNVRKPKKEEIPKKSN